MAIRLSRGGVDPLKTRYAHPVLAFLHREGGRINEAGSKTCPQRAIDADASCLAFTWPYRGGGPGPARSLPRLTGSLWTIVHQGAGAKRKAPMRIGALGALAAE